MKFKHGYVRLPRSLANTVAWAKKAIEDSNEVDKVLRRHTISEGYAERVRDALRVLAELRDNLGWWIEEADD